LGMSRFSWLVLLAPQQLATCQDLFLTASKASEADSRSRVTCSYVDRACIYDHSHKFYDERTTGSVDDCCATCHASHKCRAWAFYDFKGGQACALFNQSGGSVHDGDCVSSGGQAPQARPYPDRTPPGPPCKNCPNIVFSLTDDQDVLLGGWTPMQQTQAAMQAKGATMTQWRIHTPICSPSRSELVSGRYFHNIKSNVPVPVLDRILYAGSDHVNGSLYANETFGVFLRREKGYQMGLFGKSNFNTYEGFDRWFQGASLSYGPVTWEDDESPNGVYTQKPDEYPTALLGNKTVEWLRRPSVSASGRPWFVYFASHCPHYPATPARWYEDACAGTTAPRLPNFNHTNSLYHKLIADQPPLTDVDARLVDELARSRCQCLLSVDDSFSAIIQTVEDLGQADNTYFFFTSDHGYNLGGHRLTSEKMDMYEHALRIPLIAMGPGIPAGIKLEHLGTNVDLAPTFLALAGISTPASMDGRSMLSFLIPDAALPSLPTATSAFLQQQRSESNQEVTHAVHSNPHLWRNESFFQYYNAGPWAPPNGGDICHICKAGNGTRRPFDDASNTYIGLHVRDPALGDLKYAEFQNDCNAIQLEQRTCFNNVTTRELFDLEKDPHELHNIMDAAAPGLIAELHRRLRRYYPCKGRSCP